MPYAWKLSSGELTLLKGDVRFHDVVFGYVPEKTVLNGISLFAKPGQITYDGIDVKDIRKDDLRRSLSMVIQDTHLFTGTIAHRLSTVRNSNAIMVLEKGEIIERGSHDELLEQKGRYYQLYTGQFELE